jgi:hypothetical protein
MSIHFEVYLSYFDNLFHKNSFTNKFGGRSCNVMVSILSLKRYTYINMDYHAEINEIKCKITRLEAQLEAATGEERIVISNRIIALEYTRTELYKHLPLPVATAGNSHSI